MIVPKDNRKDMIEEVPEDVRSAMKVEYVDNVAQVLNIALEPTANRKSKAQSRKSKVES